MGVIKGDTRSVDYAHIPAVESQIGTACILPLTPKALP